MEKIVVFLILSVPIIYVSRRNLLQPDTHGFYRFLSWECILWLGVSNIVFWFDEPFRLNQVFSWILLVISGVFVISGIVTLKRKGNPLSERQESELYNFEKTSALVDTGIYKYIRHPLYSSLLFLGWGIYLKKPDLILLVVAFLMSVFLYLTARCDEKECTTYFGQKYKDYMNRSKRFVPFVF
ncbi:MAG: isoprenylcysteine carboxylmethyltransferase family protein [Bacteroidales bacterium]